MPDRLDEIANQYEKALVRQCKRIGCNVSMKGISSKFLLLDLDEQGAPLSTSEKRGDYLFFTEHESVFYAIALELMKGGAGPGKVKGQLQASARAAERIFSPHESVSLTPVLVHGGGTHKASWDRIRIKFRKANLPVRRERCGTSMLKILGAAQTRWSSR